MAVILSPFGRQLRYWRRARSVSQFDLAVRAHSTPRYISFVESGRSRPSQQMVHRLAEALDVPIRERNGLLEAAGFAGTYRINDLHDEPMQPFCEAVTYILQTHEPFPAMVLNRAWDIIDANHAAKRFLALVDATNMPSNLAEWFFDEDSAVRRVMENWAEVAFFFLVRIRRELMANPGDERLQRLVSMAEAELKDIEPPTPAPESDFVLCPAMKLRGSSVNVIGMVASFGSAREVTLDELRVEFLYPRDPETAAFFRDLATEKSVRLANRAEAAQLA